ncbi:MAG: glycosyltransferase family 2 protein, partial [Candidatus Bathyarchaeia archaeon]
NIPIKRLIIVDGFSTDGTLEIVKNFCSKNKVELVLIYSAGTRAVARQRAIEAVETEWFMFVDSDVLLCNGWMKMVEKYLKDESVGALHGIDIPVDRDIKDFSEAMARLRKILRRPPKEHPSVKRGFTGDVLIRTSVVKDIRIPSFLHYYEDKYIQRHVLGKGYKWLVTQEPYCYHHKAMSRVLKDALPSGYFEGKMGYVPIRKSVIAMFTIFPKALYAYLLKRNFSMVKNQIKFQVLYTIGVLKSRFSP